MSLPDNDEIPDDVDWSTDTFPVCPDCGGTRRVGTHWNFDGTYTRITACTECDFVDKIHESVLRTEVFER